MNRGPLPKLPLGVIRTPFRVYITPVCNSMSCRPYGGICHV